MSQKNFYLTNIILIFIFLIPTIIFGHQDVEEYYQGYFSTKLIFEDFSFLFKDYIDFFGLGTSFPTGFIFLHPSFFFHDPYLFYISFNIINLFIQCIFFKKILDFYKLEYSFFIFYLLIFSLPNFNYLLSDNWPSVSLTYSLIFPIIYFLLKFLDTQKYNYFFLFILLLIYQNLNGHFGNHLIYLLFYLIIIFIKNNFFFLKKKIFYLGVSIYIISLSENLFWTLKHFQDINYIFLIILGGLLLILMMFSKLIFENFYILCKKLFYFLPYIVILNSLLVVGFLYFYFKDDFLSRLDYYSYSIPIISFLSPIFYFFSDNNLIFNYKITYYYFLGIDLILLTYIYLTFIKKNNTDQKLNFNNDAYLKMFIIIVVILLIPQYILVKFQPGIYKLRDLLIFVSIILFLKNFSKINSNKYIFFLIIIVPFIVYLKNFEFIYKNYNGNHVKENISKNSTLHNELKILNSNSDFKRIVLSPVLLENNLLSKEGIYSFVDYFNYNLYPINTFCKKCKLQEIYNKDKFLGNMYGRTKFNYNDINLEFFSNFFNITYLFFLEEEISKLNQSSFKIIKKIPITIIKDGNLEKSFFYIAENINKSLLTIKNNYKESLKNCEDIKCLLNKDNFELNEKLFLERINLNQFKLTNISEKEVNYIFPFNNDLKNWKVDMANSKNVFSEEVNDFLIVTLSPNNSALIKTKEFSIVFISRVLGLFCFIIIFVIILVRKNKNQSI